MSRFRNARAFVTLAIFASASGPTVFAAELRSETIRAWNAYIAATEARIDAEVGPEGPFLVQELSRDMDAIEAVHAGKVYVVKRETLNLEGKKIPIPDGRIHHWIGSVLIQNVELSEVLDWLRDCGHFETHFEEVERARVLSDEGDTVRCFLRVQGKKVRTVHYNTEQTIRYRRLGTDRAASRTEATRIVQLKDAGSPKESEMPEGRDSGYLWRWNSYWRFKAAGNQVIVECETVSLSRSVPLVIWWFVKPFMVSVPKQYLENTLGSLREAIESASRPATR